MSAPQDLSEHFTVQDLQAIVTENAARRSPTRLTLRPLLVT